MLLVSQMLTVIFQQIHKIQPALDAYERFNFSDFMEKTGDHDMTQILIRKMELDLME